jgi:hypothetical protein
VDLFVRGAGGDVQHRSYNGSTWSSWTSLGGYALSAPAAVAPNSNRIDTWVRGADNALHHKVWQAATGWSEWNGIWLGGPQP